MLILNVLRQSVELMSNQNVKFLKKKPVTQFKSLPLCWYRGAFVPLLGQLTHLERHNQCRKTYNMLINRKIIKEKKYLFF